MGALDLPRANAATYGGEAGRGLQHFSRDLDETAHLLSRISAGADTAESTKLIGQGTAGLEAALQEGKLQYEDPEEYKNFVDNAIQTTFDNTISGATNPRTKERVQAHLADNVIRAKKSAEFGYFEKKKDRAIADTDTALKQFSEMAIKEPSDENRNGIYKMAGALVGEMKAHNFFSAKQAVDTMQEFNKKVVGDRMAIMAANDPLGFDEAVVTNKFPDADAIMIERAMNVADKAIEANNRRENALNKARSGSAERAFVERAQAHTLDEGQLAEAARLYSWDKDKVDKILRIHKGLKENSPHSEALIADALEPVLTKMNPTLGDVRQANQKLTRLVQAGVSPDSMEYRNAMRVIQSMEDRLTNQGFAATGRQLAEQNRSIADQNRQRAEENRRRADAERNIRDSKNKLNNLRNFYQPDMDPEDKRKQTAKDNLTLEMQKPEERQQFVKDREKELADKAKARSTWKPSADALKRLQKK